MLKESLSALASKRRALRLLAALVLILIVVATQRLLNDINQPAQGVVLKETTIKTEGPAPAAGRYNGRFISFKLPPSYKIASATPTGGLLEQVSLISTDHTGKYVAIGVSREALANDAGVNYRQLHPELYRAVGNPGKPVFSKQQGGYEYTGYLSHEGLVASISLTSEYTSSLNGDYAAITDSWQWK